MSAKKSFGITIIVALVIVAAAAFFIFAPSGVKAVVGLIAIVTTLFLLLWAVVHGLMYGEAQSARADQLRRFPEHKRLG